MGSWEVLADQEPHLHAGLRLEGDGPGSLGGWTPAPLEPQSELMVTQAPPFPGARR